jgi:hypothetical protein
MDYLYKILIIYIIILTAKYTQLEIHIYPENSLVSTPTDKPDKDLKYTIHAPLFNNGSF